MPPMQTRRCLTSVHALERCLAGAVQACSLALPRGEPIPDVGHLVVEEQLGQHHLEVVRVVARHGHQGVGDQLAQQFVHVDVEKQPADQGTVLMNYPFLCCAKDGVSQGH